MKGKTGAGRAAAAAFAISFAVLIANGRAIGSGDTNAAERTAVSLVERGTFVLLEDGASDPFTRPTPGGRVSIYPALPALLATPIFLAFSRLVDLNPAGQQAAGKLTAALLSASAISLMAWTFSKRTTALRALGSALLFGLGTSVYSTAQALWQHPAALLFLAAALSALERLEATEVSHRAWPGVIAALSLSLAAASRPAVIPMCAALFLFLLHRAPQNRARLIAVACLPVVFVAGYNAHFFGAPWRFGPGLGGRFFAAFPESVAGLLISPARGLFVFTPLALVALWGLVDAARHSTLARGILGGVAVHFIFMATWNEWHGGESFGPRLLTDMLPCLFFFLPEALAAWPLLGAGAGLVSVSVQLLGGFTYDYRWERLHQRGREFDAALWSWRDSPIVFAAREGVLIQGIPEWDGSRLRLRLRRWVPLGAEGSSIEATRSGLRISGDAVFKDVRLERGARSSLEGMVLVHPGDALAFRSRSAGPRTLRLIGSFPGGSFPGGSFPGGALSDGSPAGILRIETGLGSTSLPLTGAFDLALPLLLAVDDDVFVRAEAGELRLKHLDLTLERSQTLSLGTSPHFSFVRRTSK